MVFYRTFIFNQADRQWQSQLSFCSRTQLPPLTFMVSTSKVASGKQPKQAARKLSRKLQKLTAANRKKRRKGNPVENAEKFPSLLCFFPSHPFLACL